MKYKNLASNIKKLRKDKGLTQKELGQKICKSEISIRKYESGTVNIPPSTLFDICDILCVSLREILGDNYKEYIDNNFEESINVLEDKAESSIKTLQKYSMNTSSISPFFERKKIIDENGIKDLIYSTVVDIMFLACENNKLGYSIDSFTESEIKEISSFVYNAYSLKVDEILRKRQNKDN